jgi:hypothetical protein
MELRTVVKAQDMMAKMGEGRSFLLYVTAKWRNVIRGSLR